MGIDVVIQLLTDDYKKYGFEEGDVLSGAIDLESRRVLIHTPKHQHFAVTAAHYTLLRPEKQNSQRFADAQAGRRSCSEKNPSPKWTIETKRDRLVIRNDDQFFVQWSEGGRRAELIPLSASCDTLAF